MVGFLYIYEDDNNKAPYKEQVEINNKEENKKTKCATIKNIRMDSEKCPMDSLWNALLSQHKERNTRHAKTHAIKEALFSKCI